MKLLWNSWQSNVIAAGEHSNLHRRPVLHASIADKKEEIATICRRHRVARLEVFGSAARGTDFDPERSDADFLVEYCPPLLPGLFERRISLQNELRAVLGREIDLIRVGTIRNRYRKATIDRDRETVFEA